jgi:hypothetical protein
MATIFISYAHEDIEFVERLVAALEERDNKVWWDERSIPPTVPFPPEIEKGIIESNALLFILSPDSISSEWCLRELGYALYLWCTTGRRPNWGVFRFESTGNQ